MGAYSSPDQGQNQALYAEGQAFKAWLKRAEEELPDDYYIRVSCSPWHGKEFALNVTFEQKEKSQIVH